jgi:hypothetical protein
MRLFRPSAVAPFDRLNGDIAMLERTLDKESSSHFSLLALALVAAMTACSSDVPVGIESPTEGELAAMNTAIQDEYRAEAVYLAVVADFGEIMPFYRVMFAEERHSEAVASLFVKRGLDVPASDQRAESVPRFDSVSAACAFGVEAEIANIDMYEELLESAVLQADTRRVFENIQRASLENHLPAFEACR